MLQNKVDIQENVKNLVSVIIPSYNHSHFIGECLNSIINDAYEPKEIILIDDGSKDKTRDAIESWMHVNEDWLAKHRFYCEFKENEGMVKTLNKLISNAQGEFICLVASDDYLLPSGIQTRIDYLHSNPDKLAVFGDCIVVDSQNALLYNSGIEDRLLGKKRYLVQKELLPIEIILHWCPSGAVLLLNRKAFLQIGTYDETFMIEDLDFYLRLVAADLLGFIDYPVCAYRIHGSNTSLNQKQAYNMHNAIYKIIQKNISKFFGLQRLILLAWMWSSHGSILKIKGYHLQGIFFGNIGRVLRVAARVLYAIKLIVFHMIEKSRSL